MYIRDQSCYGDVRKKLPEARSYNVATQKGGMLRCNRSALIHIGIDVATPQAGPTLQTPIAHNPPQLPEIPNTPPHITDHVRALFMSKTSGDNIASTPVVS